MKEKKKKLTWAASNLEMALFTSDLFQKVKDEPHPQVRPKTSRVCWGSLGICWLQIRLTILRGCSEEQLALPTGNKPGLHWPWGNCLLPYLRNGVNDTYFLREKKIGVSVNVSSLSRIVTFHLHTYSGGCCGDSGIEEKGNRGMKAQITWFVPYSAAPRLCNQGETPCGAE